ncbi:MAG: pyridoxamine 5'-phosphate oxidase [Methyloceanibacter sp.]
MNETKQQPFGRGPQAPGFSAAQDPFDLFARWMEEASASEPIDPNAMALATADVQGLPNVRMVLLKAAGPEGFIFYTNCESAKGLELAANPKAALLLYWKSLNRQIRVRGPVESLSDADADAYFATRSRESRIGAWASRQSRSLASRAALEEAVEHHEAEFADRDVPRPSYWKSYRVAPLEIEFWASRPHRLHDRIVFRRAAPDASWVKTRLYP